MSGGVDDGYSWGESPADNWERLLRIVADMGREASREHHAVACARGWAGEDNAPEPMDRRWIAWLPALAIAVLLALTIGLAAFCYHGHDAGGGTHEVSSTWTV